MRKFVLLFLIPLTFDSRTETVNKTGTVTSVTGSAIVKRLENGESLSVSVQRGTELIEGDILETGDDAAIIIVLKDGSSIEVYENTSLMIDSVEVIDDSVINSVLLFFGRILNRISKSVQSREKYEVATPTSVCGVRGTEFIVALAPDGTTRVGVIDGEVVIETDEWIENLEKGKELTISYDSKIEERKRFEPEKIDWNKWNEEREETLLKKSDEIMAQMLSRIKKVLEGEDERQRKLDEALLESERFAEDAHRAKRENKTGLLKKLQKKLDRSIEKSGRFAREERLMSIRVASALEFLENLARRIGMEKPELLTERLRRNLAEIRSLHTELRAKRLKFKNMIRHKLPKIHKHIRELKRQRIPAEGK